MNDLELKCVECNRPFIITAAEQEWFNSRGFDQPRRCKDCRKKRKMLRKNEQVKTDNERLLKKKAEENALFAEKLKTYHLAKTNEIDLNPDKTLYILGNGFDLMHGVHSSYRDFEKTIGKNNSLRFALETYLDVNDIWADFEEALGHLNVGMMLNAEIIDMWLDNFGAYDPGAQAADFFAAVDTATMPASDIMNDLPRRFRMWVESLKCDTDQRPLKGLIKNGKVLCFNYTEFVEDLYGIDESNVCYIHGCRRKKKYHPKEKLILGHRPGAEDEQWNSVNIRSPRFKNRYKQYMFDAAIETASRNIEWYDDAMTKKSSDIIKAHQSFFDGLANVNNAVVIGHSLSPVDWDYFKEVISKSSINNWYIGCHSLHDIENLERIKNAMGLKNVTVILT
ncbi:MAG: zinc-ribbon domain containing protein [Ruminococcus sp.]|nr:zinc-ribbon domain containing protein [Ruminococcus sp.]